MTISGAAGSPTASLPWRFKARTFAITFFSYAMFHVARKSFSAIKGELSREEWMESSLTSSQSNMYGMMDMVFMGCYASGLFVSGTMGDRVNLRYFITLGMISTGAALIVFGLGGFAQIHSFWFYIILWGINGLVQSCGWPSNVAVMSKWFDHDERGVIMGLWSGCSAFGNILGGALVGMLCTYLKPELAWKVTFLSAGGLLWLFAIIVLCFLIPDPKDVDRIFARNEIPDTPSTKPSVLTPGVHKPSTLPGISFWKAWTIPGVIPYAFAYACVKSVSYSLFFWLPYYLTVVFSMENSKANFYSILYDVGAIMGSIIGGFVTDQMKVRSPYVVVSLISSTITLHFLYGSSDHTTGVLLLLLGLLTGGPEMLITTAIAADLGTHPSLQGNSEALATVTGIIDGTGSFGAALMQFVVGALAHCKQTCNMHDVCTTKCGWEVVFAVLQVMLIVGILCLTKMLYQDVKKLVPSRSRDHRPVLQGEVESPRSGPHAETPSHNADDLISA